METNAKHSPGPWTVSSEHRSSEIMTPIRSADQRTVAEVWPQLPEETAANARLIAAAPEFFEVSSCVCALFGTEHPQGVVELKGYVAALRDLIGRVRGNGADVYQRQPMSGNEMTLEQQLRAACRVERNREQQ